MEPTAFSPPQFMRKDDPQGTSNPPKKKRGPSQIGLRASAAEWTQPIVNAHWGAGICPGMGTQIEIPSPRPGPDLQKYVFISIFPKTHGKRGTIVFGTRYIFEFFKEINWGCSRIDAYK